MGYPKYGWVGNRISDDDMEQLYRMKLRTRRPITVMVAEAVCAYVKSQKRIIHDNSKQRFNRICDHEE